MNDAGALAPLKDRVDVWHLASLPGPRGTTAAVLAQIVRDAGVGGDIVCHDTPAEAMRAAREAAGGAEEESLS